ncbi:MAG: hypothetical protein IGS23_17945 [Rivularia sp. T60_A2020_040]|nr:hypothetical protein [Rivularia sp. T60_A2020_040]
MIVEQNHNCVQLAKPMQVIANCIDLIWLFYINEEIKKRIEKTGFFAEYCLNNVRHCVNIESIQCIYYDLSVILLAAGKISFI